MEGSEIKFVEYGDNFTFVELYRHIGIYDFFPLLPLGKFEMQIDNVLHIKIMEINIFILLIKFWNSLELSKKKIRNYKFKKLKVIVKIINFLN